MIQKILQRLPGGHYYNTYAMSRRIEKQYGGDFLKAAAEYAKACYWRSNRYPRASKLAAIDFSEIRSLDGTSIHFPPLEGELLEAFSLEIMDLVMPFYLGQHTDSQEMRGIAVEGPYEYSEEVCLERGDVVVDCGANIGCFSAIAAKRAGTVYAFEPNPVLIAHLETVGKLNGNIRVQNYALSSHSGTLEFTVTDACGSNSLVEVGEKRGNGERKLLQTIPVQTVTLDEWAEENHVERIDFIKADIEGAERDMLSGATRILREFAPKLSICTYHFRDDPQVLEGIVKAANPDYIVTHDYKKMYCFVPGRTK